MTTNFDDYVRELEARATPEEQAMLVEARRAVRATLEQAERKIAQRERIDRFVAKMIDKYRESSVTRHPWPESVFNHDGPCIEVMPPNCGSMRFTTLLFKAEIWGIYGNGERVSDDPVCVKGMDDEEVIANFISYIDGWIDHTTTRGFEGMS